MIGNDRGGGKEMVRSLGGRSFQRRGAVMDGSVVEHEMKSDRGRERVRPDDDRVERVGCMVKSSRSRESFSHFVHSVT